jgi:hypothetical protein
LSPPAISRNHLDGLPMGIESSNPLSSIEASGLFELVMNTMNPCSRDI